MKKSYPEPISPQGFKENLALILEKRDIVPDSQLYLSDDLTPKFGITQEEYQKYNWKITRLLDDYQDMSYEDRKDLLVRLWASLEYNSMWMRHYYYWQRKLVGLSGVSITVMALLTVMFVILAIVPFLT